jgi:hypothetical protein
MSKEFKFENSKYSNKIQLLINSKKGLFEIKKKKIFFFEKFLHHL